MRFSSRAANDALQRECILTEYAISALVCPAGSWTGNRSGNECFSKMIVIWARALFFAAQLSASVLGATCSLRRSEFVKPHVKKRMMVTEHDVS